MAKPRVFVSSTYYDLKYVRSSLELFIDSLGYDSVLSEKGDVAYASDIPLDESCYREVGIADIYVLIIGGRYGSEASQHKSNAPKPDEDDFYHRYESITKLEYKAAAEKDIPVYILIEKSVYAELQTFHKNKDNKGISYAHVDSVNVFHFIDEILAQPKNNPVFSFEKYDEIQEWLRAQWAGTFRELLQRKSDQQQLTSLSAKVTELGEVNQTLKKYLETVLNTVAAGESSKEVIEDENKRLTEASQNSLLRENRFVRFLMRQVNIPLSMIKELILDSNSVAELVKNAGILPNETSSAVKALVSNEDAMAQFNLAREILGSQPIELPARPRRDPLAELLALDSSEPENSVKTAETRSSLQSKPRVKGPSG